MIYSQSVSVHLDSLNIFDFPFAVVIFQIMASPNLRTSQASDSITRIVLPVNDLIADRIINIADEALHLLRSQRDRVTGRALIRAAMAMIGEPVGAINFNEEKDAAGENLDDSDFHDMCHNVEAITKKVKESIQDRENLVAYLKATHRLLGTGAGSGSLTPRPRDYAAAMSRFNEESLSSPSQQRASTHMERLEHAHSIKRP